MDEAGVDVRASYKCRLCGIVSDRPDGYCDAATLKARREAGLVALDAAIVSLHDAWHTMPARGAESLEFLSYVDKAHSHRFYVAPLPQPHDFDAVDEFRIRARGAM
jgi:hypothetical protein